MTNVETSHYFVEAIKLNLSMIYYQPSEKKKIVVTIPRRIRISTKNYDIVRDIKGHFQIVNL